MKWLTWGVDGHGVKHYLCAHCEEVFGPVAPDSITHECFARLLHEAAGTLTAAQIAEATGASKRTVEGWRAGKEPPHAYRADILTRIKRARARAERRHAGAMQAPNGPMSQPRTGPHAR